MEKIRVVELKTEDFKAVRRAIRWENRFQSFRKSTATASNIAGRAKLPYQTTMDILMWMFRTGEIAICTDSMGEKTYH